MLTCILFSSPASATTLASVKMAEISLESVIDASKPTMQEHNINLELVITHCKTDIQANPQRIPG